MVLTLPVYSLRYGPNIACLLSSFSIPTLRSIGGQKGVTTYNTLSRRKNLLRVKLLFRLSMVTLFLRIGDNRWRIDSKYGSEIFKFCPQIVEVFVNFA